MAHVVIKIDTNSFVDPNRMGSWAKQMRLVLNELAFEGKRMDVYDSDGNEIIGSVTIVPVKEDF